MYIMSTGFSYLFVMVEHVYKVNILFTCSYILIEVASLVLLFADLPGSL